MSVRLVGTTSATKRNIAQKAEAGSCPCCGMAAEVALLPTYGLGEYSILQAEGMAIWTKFGPWAHDDLPPFIMRKSSAPPHPLRIGRRPLYTRILWIHFHGLPCVMMVWIRMPKRPDPRSLRLRLPNTRTEGRTGAFPKKLFLNTPIQRFKSIKKGIGGNTHASDLGHTESSSCVFLQKADYFARRSSRSRRS